MERVCYGKFSVDIFESPSTDSIDSSIISSSTIIEDVKYSSEANDSTAMIVYYYFDFGDARKQSARGCLCSLMKQICALSKNVPSAILRLYARYDSGQREPPLDALQATFREILESLVDHIYVVVDALDECTDLSVLLDVVEILREWNIETLHALFACRPQTVIEKRFSALNLKRFDLEASLLSSDISFYIQSITRHNSDLAARWKAHEIAEIEQTLEVGADGM